jgi:FkbM family methyltransferase
VLVDHFHNLFRCLAAYPELHPRGTPFYQFADDLVRAAFLAAKPAFEAGEEVQVGEIGKIRLPYEKMGAIDSLDLFGLDELLMFAFYFQNRGRYRRVADIGANLGLHSILLGRCGYEVESYEPDPAHFLKLQRNLALNGITSCTPYQQAVSEKNGTMQFVRVLGNTTSSHLAGAKAHPYGELERFDVPVVDIREIAARVDLFKIDAEGHEAVLLNALPIEAWMRVDAFVEIGTPENAQAVFDRFNGSAVHIFSQKTGWGRVQAVKDMPVSYKEGGIFVSAKPEMPWSGGR